MQTSPATTLEKPAEKPKRGLGRGLDALFADGEARLDTGSSKLETTVTEAPTSNPQPSSSAQRTLPVTALTPCPYQPRRKFDEAELKLLSDSLRVHGVLQPLLVRPAANDETKYEIIAGERRWRAAQLAQLHDVPVVIRTISDRDALEMALVENVQRSNLTAIEEAEGYQRLIDEFGHTQDELAIALGKSRTHVSGLLRLLTLPESVRVKVQHGLLGAANARLLAGMKAEDAAITADIIIRKRMSVRQTERYVARLKRGAPTRGSAAIMRRVNQIITEKGGTANLLAKDADVLALEAELATHLGLKVDIQSTAAGSGQVAIHFTSLDQLDELLQKLTRAGRG